MKSHGDDNKPEAAQEHPQPHSAPAPKQPGPSLEERVAKLEAWIPRLEALIGAP